MSVLILFLHIQYLPLTVMWVCWHERYMFVFHYDFITTNLCLFNIILQYLDVYFYRKDSKLSLHMRVLDWPFSVEIHQSFQIFIFTMVGLTKIFRNVPNMIVNWTHLLFDLLCITIQEKIIFKLKANMTSAIP